MCTKERTSKGRDMGWGRDTEQHQRDADRKTDAETRIETKKRGGVQNGTAGQGKMKDVQETEMGEENGGGGGGERDVWVS